LAPGRRRAARGRAGSGWERVEGVQLERPQAEPLAVPRTNELDADERRRIIRRR
jgi:hypothetical protein